MFVNQPLIRHHLRGKNLACWWPLDQPLPRRRAPGHRERMEKLVVERRFFTKAFTRLPSDFRPRLAMVTHSAALAIGCRVAASVSEPASFYYAAGCVPSPRPWLFPMFTVSTRSLPLLLHTPFLPATM